MSVSTERTVWCDYRPHDAGRCRQWIQFNNIDQNSVREAREQARAAGWASRRSPGHFLYDLCPEHRELVPGSDFADWQAG